MKRLEVFLAAAAFLAFSGLPSAADGGSGGMFSAPDPRRDFFARLEWADRGTSAAVWDGLARDSRALMEERERADFARILELRFASWLERRPQEASAPELRSFLDAIEREDLAHILETDEDGKLKADAKGDPVFKGAENFAEDEAGRRLGIEAKMEELLRLWEEGARAENQELLSELTGPLREIAEPLAAAGIEESRRAARREFERIARLAESRFLAARLGDSFSLRKKSESEASGETVRRLVGETEALLSAEMNRLSASLPAGDVETPAYIRPDPETWSEDFRLEFKRGIDLWSRAEERFIAERIGWETRTARGLSEFEEAWDAAAADFARSREAWFAGMRELAETGRESWARHEADFLRDYDRLMAETASAAAAELDNFRGETAAYLDVYRRSSELIEAAEYNGAILRKELERLLRSENPPEEDIRILREELAYWTGENGIAARYEGTRVEAENLLFDLEARVRGYGGVGDSLDREIGRMKAVLAALEEEAASARAVLDYALDLSSKRPTEARTAEALSAARAEYSLAEAALGAALESLGRRNRDLSAAAGTVRAAKEDLQRAEDAFQSARAACEEAFSLYRTGDGEVLAAMIETYDAEIARYYADGEYGRLAAWRRWAAAGEAVHRSELLLEALELAGAVSGVSAAAEEGAAAIDILPELGLTLGDASAEGMLRAVCARELFEAEPLSAADGEALMRALAENAGDEEGSVRFQVYMACGRAAPAFLLMYRERDAAEIRNTLLSADYSSAEGILALLDGPIGSGSLPSYLRDALDRYIYLKAVHAGAGSEVFAGLPAGFAFDASRVGDELAAFQSIVESALTVFTREETPSDVKPEEAEAAGAALFERERGVLHLARTVESLRAGLEALETDRELYRRGFVEPRQVLFENAAEARDEARKRHEEALAAFSRLSADVLALQADADAAREFRRKARTALRRAEDIYDYASAGYTSPNFSPEAVLEKRLAEAGRARYVLGILESIRRGGKPPPAERADESYLLLKEEEKARRESLQYLSRVEAAAAGDAAVAGKSLEEAGLRADSAVREIFNLVRPGGDGSSEALMFSFDPAVLNSRTLKVFSSSDETRFAAETAAYFAGGETAKKLSADAALWMIEMARTGNVETVLRDFALAYYYDAVVQNDRGEAGSSEVYVGLFEHPSWKLLLADYVDLGPYPLFFGSGDYPPERWTVEDYLKNTTGEVFRKIESNPNLRSLYAFYKMMIVTGNLAGGTASIGKDIGDAVFDHVDAPARRRQRSCLKWYRVWKHPEGRRIRALRSDIAAARLSGLDERAAFASAVEDFTAASAAMTDARNRLASLGFREIQSEEDLLLTLGRISGEAPSAGFMRSVRDLFAGFLPEERENGLAAAAALRRRITFEAELFRSAAEARAGELESAERAAYERYRSLIEGDSLDEEALREAALELYGNSAFSAEDRAELDLAFTKSVSAETRAGRLDKLLLLGRDLENLFRTGLAAAADETLRSLAGEYETMKKRRAEWEARTADLLAAGGAGWLEGADLLSEARERLLGEFAAEYRESVELWERRFKLLERNRNEWIQTGVKRTAEAGAIGLAGELGLDGERLLAEVESVRVPDIGSPAGGLEGIVREAVDGRLMESLTRAAGRLAGRAEGEGTLLAAFSPGVWNPSAALQRSQEFVRGVEEDILRRTSFAAAVEMGRSVKEAEASVAKRVEEANRGVEKNLTDTLRNAGYAREGNLFSRRVVIDETLFGGIEREKQSIEGYRRFAAPAFDHGADLSRKNLEGKSAGYISTMIKTAKENLLKYLELLFGRNQNNSGDSLWGKATMSLKELYEDAADAYRASSGYDRVENGRAVNRADGLFSWHVGYAPVMKRNDPENAAEAGYGELGRIMTLYFRNQARQMRGLASFDIAWYNEKMWDDDKNNDGRSDGLLGAPTVRSAANIAVGIAAAATGNVWAAAALNLADDTAFTVMDVAGGSTSLYSGMKSLGAQAALSVARTGLGAGFFGGAPGAGGGVFEKTLLKGGELFAANAASGAAASLRFDSNGLSFRGNVFRDAVIGKQALVSYTGGLLGVFLEGGLEGLSLRHAGEIRSFAGFAGGLAAAGVEYGLTGETRLNIADFGMFGIESGGRTVGGGMLELNLGGKGSLLALGAGGTDISLGRILEAAGGAGTWVRNMEIELADRFGPVSFAEGYRGAESVGTALRSLYSFGDERGRDLLADILSGRRSLHVGFTDARGLSAGDEIHLANLGVRGDSGSRLLAGVVLQHEAYRDGVRVGETQADGTRETADSNFAELEAGSLARLAMAAGIEKEYAGFLGGNKDLLFETILYDASLRNGDEGLYLDYLKETYRNGEDFYFPEVTTKGEYQNQAGYERYPLLASKTLAAVAAENAARLDAAVDVYIRDIARSSGYLGDLKDFVLPPDVTRDKIAKEITNVLDTRKQFGYAEIKYESIASDGCMMTAAMYGAEALSGRDLEAPEVNRLLKEAGLYVNGSELSAGLLGRAMELLTGGEYRFELQRLENGLPGAELLRAMSDSPDAYLAHLRIKREGGGAAYHSEMLSSIDWGTDNPDGGALEVRGVHTANPWRGSGYTGKTYRTGTEIARWDIYKASPTWRYYYNRSSEWQVARN